MDDAQTVRTRTSTNTKWRRWIFSLNRCLSAAKSRWPGQSPQSNAGRKPSILPMIVKSRRPSSRIAAMATVVLLLTMGVWLALLAGAHQSVQAQEREDAPSTTQRPDAETETQGRVDRLSEAAAGSKDSGPSSQPTVVQEDEESQAIETVVDEDESSVSNVPSSGIAAIAGVGGAGLSVHPESEIGYSVPVGTLLQATGRSEDSAWLYVNRDAEIKGGEEIEPALAGWTSKVELIAFSIESLPVLDVDNMPIRLPDPPPSTSDADEGATETDATETMAIETIVIDDQAIPQPEEGADTNHVVAYDEDAGTNGLDDTTKLTGLVTLDDSRLNVRSAPGTATTIVGKLLPDDLVSVLGLSEDSAWLLITAGRDSELVGWVAADFVDVDGDLNSLRLLPVSTLSESPSKPEAVPTDSVSGIENVADVSIVTNGSSGGSDQIVFQTSLGATFYAYNLKSGALWPLTNGFDPAISPDGRTVAFTRDGGENGIYLIDIDGSDERAIFTERGRLASPKWSAEGEWIVFSRGNTFAECYQLGPTCLTASQIRDRNPNIDLGRFELVKEPRYHIAMVDRNGDNYTDIAALDTARAPDWIDAGIVYQSSAGLQITDVSPNAENRLVIDDYLKPYFHDPDWQPGQGAGGGRIVYMGKEGSHWEIFTVNPDGSGVTALTRPSTTLAGELPSNVAPAWSPDGSKIIFLSNRADNGGSASWRLWMMDADGGNQRPLPVDLAIDYTFGDEQAVGW